jgi:hypothetical protein
MVPDYTRTEPDACADAYVRAVDGLIHAAGIYSRDPWSNTGTTLLRFYARAAMRSGLTVNEIADITEISAGQIATLTRARPEGKL